MKNIEGKDERLQADIHQLDHKHEEGIHVNKQIHSEYRKTPVKEGLRQTERRQSLRHRKKEENVFFVLNHVLRTIKQMLF